MCQRSLTLLIKRSSWTYWAQSLRNVNFDSKKRLETRFAHTSTQTLEHVKVTAYRVSCLSCILPSQLNLCKPTILAIDYHKPLWSALACIIDRDVHKITSDPKYADEISFLRSDQLWINQVEREICAKLLTECLHVNENKTERYHIQRGGDDAWKKCRYLGLLAHTEKCIKRRKGLTIDLYKTFESIFSSKHVSEKVKVRVFATYIQSIFMYNSELWTLTQTLKDSIDVFQRKLLRKIIYIKWPRMISNKGLHALTEMNPWSHHTKVYIDMVWPSNALTSQNTCSKGT